MCTLVVSLGLALYALFHGYFDHGQFEIKQTQWSSSREVAMVAERSDQEAMSGYTYFVLDGDHPFSPAELRLAYHSGAVIFAAASNCLTLHWDGPNKLVVTCSESSIPLDQINVQKLRSGEVNISYTNIPIK
jgi:hypothetical protein